MTRIVCISDTHSRHQNINIPEGDILIHAGDFSPTGQHDNVKKFLKWFSNQPHKYKVYIAGNHDRSFENEPLYKQEMVERYSAAIYLEDSFVKVKGLKIYGSPWQPRFFDWAFNLDRGIALKEKWAEIPNDTDILVTHGPPRGIMDPGYPKNEPVGCDDLLERVNQLPNLKLHVFGHLHSGHGVMVKDYGISSKQQITFVNAAMVGERNELLDRKPIVIEI